MKTSKLIRREALANLFASGRVSLATAVLALALGAGSVALSAWDAQARVDQWLAQESAGRSVLVVTGTVTTVPSALCDSARAISSVSSSGGVVSRESETTDLPGSPTVDVLRVTSGFAAVAFGQRGTDRAAVLAPPDLAARLGLAPGRDLLIGGETYAVDLAPVASSRVEGINDALVVVVPPSGYVDRCYVAMQPESRSSGPAAVAAWFGAGFSTAPLLDMGAQISDPDAAFRGRIGVWLCPAAAVILVAFQCLVWHSRRGDFALYRILRMPRSSIVLMQLWELAALIAVPFAAGALAGSVLLLRASSVTTISTLIGFGGAMVCLLLATPVGALLTLRARSIDVIKGS